MYTTPLITVNQTMWADFGGRSNICEYRTRLSSSSKTNSKISHQAVAEVAVFREAIMEEEETEEEVGQEELVEEAEAEVEGLDCEHLVNLPKIVIKTCTSMATKGLESRVRMIRLHSTLR